METVEKNKSQTRPYWHVDLKWFFGLTFIFIFGFNLFFAGLAILTNEKNGIEIMTKMITMSFSRDGVDNQKDIDKFRQMLETAPNQTIRPIPALNLTISKGEIEGLDAREVRYAIFRKVAKPIYFNGKGAEEVLNTPEARANFEKDTTILRLFSQQSHRTIVKILWVNSVLSVMALLLVAFFSYRVGRLANPALIVVMSTWFWAIAFTALSFITKSFSDQALSFGVEGQGYGAMVGPYIREMLPSIMTTFSQIYLIAFLCGIAGLILSGLIWTILRFKK